MIEQKCFVRCALPVTIKIQDYFVSYTWESVALTLTNILILLNMTSSDEKIVSGFVNHYYQSCIFSFKLHSRVSTYSSDYLSRLSKINVYVKNFYLLGFCLRNLIGLVVFILLINVIQVDDVGCRSKRYADAKIGVQLHSKLLFHLVVGLMSY
jgi:hypothetical protein